MTQNNPREKVDAEGDSDVQERIEAEYGLDEEDLEDLEAIEFTCVIASC